MKSNELRIGNYVIINTNTNEPFCMDYDAMHDTFIDNDFEDLHPIPLTEEWLLKFGFKQYNEWYYEKYPLTLVGKKYYDATIHDIEDKKRIQSVTIQYVHQLQNLYFALTGNELQIK